MHRLNKRIAVSRPEGGFALRVYHKEAQKKRMPRYLIKCGCCDEQLSIYYDEQLLEINGVMASIENWREVLSPLLYPEGKKEPDSAA